MSNGAVALDNPIDVRQLTDVLFCRWLQRIYLVCHVHVLLFLLDYVTAVIVNIVEHW